MPAKKDGRTKQQPNFLCVDEYGSGRGGGTTEAPAVQIATNFLSRSREYNTLCVYKLVKILRRKVAPVQVEEVSL
jgi:hypothetical protein